MIIKDPTTFHSIFIEITAHNIELDIYLKRYTEEIEKSESISMKTVSNITDSGKQVKKLAFELVDFFEAYGIKVDREYKKRMDSRKNIDETEMAEMKIKQIMEPIEEKSEQNKLDSFIMIMNYFSKEIINGKLKKEYWWDLVKKYNIPYPKKRFDMDFERGDF